MIWLYVYGFSFLMLVIQFTKLLSVYVLSSLPSHQNSMARRRSVLPSNYRIADFIPRSFSVSLLFAFSFSVPCSSSPTLCLSLSLCQGRLFLLTLTSWANEPHRASHSLTLRKHNLLRVKDYLINVNGFYRSFFFKQLMLHTHVPLIKKIK